jgi:hypothetical protein
LTGRAVSLDRYNGLIGRTVSSYGAMGELDATCTAPTLSSARLISSNKPCPAVVDCSPLTSRIKALGTASSARSCRVVGIDYVHHTGCQQPVSSTGHMDHTGCQQPVPSTKRPTRDTRDTRDTRVTYSRGCQIGHVPHTGRDQLVCQLQKIQKLQKNWPKEPKTAKSVWPTPPHELGFPLLLHRLLRCEI